MANGNGRRPMILSPHGGQANATPDDAPMTRVQVKELMVEIVGSFADSFLKLEKSHTELQAAFVALEGKHNALVSHLGLTYNTPQEERRLSLVVDQPEGQHGKPGVVSQDGEEAVSESGGGRPAPEASQALPE